jgi:hypothetical protein
LPADTWKELPGYQNFGFAVFKLKPGAMTIHPMAFSFSRRDVRTLFYPTVHIHDGKVHANADFDHVLYCQPREYQQLALDDWKESRSHAANFMKVDKTKGVVAPDQHCYKQGMHGQLPNRDTFLKILG